MAKNFLDETGLSTLINKIKTALAGKQDTISILARNKGGTGNTTGTAASVTTTENASDTLYLLGVTSSNTSNVQRDPSITIKGGIITATTFSGSLSGQATTAGSATTATTATKLGSATIGGTKKPMYLSSGTPTAFSATEGGTAKPIYLNAGTLTAISDTVGSATKPVYLNAGTITAFSQTVGSATEPVYLSAGTVTKGSLYAGGTAVTLNGTSKAASTASFYAPTSAGSNGNVLSSTGSGAPSWKQRVFFGTTAPTSASGYLPGDIFIVY